VDFYDVLDQVVELLRRRGRVTYRALQLHFKLDDESLEVLKDELITAQRLAIDEQGKILVWTGEPTAVARPTAEPAIDPGLPPLAYTPAYLTEKILASRTALEGERKHVTVLFVDIQGSTELIDGLDAEEAQHIIDPALQRMMTAVHRYEGTVSQVLGDGIMALFGAPMAHEDHALRACYAALAMQAAIRDYAETVRRTHGLALRIRVGLNSGEVVVRTISNDLHMDYSAVGQTTHLAARMEQLAAPGSILLTAATLLLVEGMVRVQPMGPVPVKGLTDPVEVFELVGASAIRRRFQVMVARGLTRFVGRETELLALQQALAQAATGHGQVVALEGEAGVGKSRLVYEFVHSYRTQDWLVLESASVSYGKATPYFPVIDLLKRYCHVEEGDDLRTIRAKVTGQVLTLDETLQDTIPALLSLLEALPDDSLFRQLGPPQRRQRTLDALNRLLLRESQAQPLLLVFEDLHWIDSETQALLNSLVESLPTARLLLLVNYRPEYQHDWGGKTYYTQSRLDPLPLASAEALLHSFLGDDLSLEALKRLLIARTEGNPFFLEESVRTLVEAGALVGAPGAYRLATPLESMQIPATVEAVLAARLDRLPLEEKRLLQTAAVIGTEISLALLQTIADLPEETLYRGLAHLQAAEFLYETHLFPDLVYTFKHALTHEVAYGSLLQERRRTLHARLAEAIETLYRDRLTDQVERLAHHAMRGEVWDVAARAYQQTGSRALARSAYREAVTCFEQALTALRHLPEQRRQETCEQVLEVLFGLRGALLQLGDLDRALAVLREAETLAQTLDDPHQLGRVSSYMARYCFLMGEHGVALAAGERALTLATRHEDLALQVTARMYLGQIYHALGQYPSAVAVLGENVAALTGDLRYEHFGLANLPVVTSRTFLAYCLAEQGAFDAAAACGAEGMQVAEVAEHANSLVIACLGVGRLALNRGDLPQAITVLEHGLCLCQSAHIALLFSATAAALGYAYALAGRMTEALPLLEQVQQTAALPSPLSALVVVWLGEIALHTGRLASVHALAEQALKLAQDRQERGNHAWALRLLGTLAAHGDPAAMAQASDYYEQAMALAEELGMRPLQAHCHRGRGALYARTGQWEQARSELSTAIELYRALGMTFWLPQAEEALAQVIRGIGPTPFL
jgi:class 3 adenylate cyclase/tetratricopeptide (TPR) repeat protein